MSGALEVGQLDNVAVDQRDPPDARPREQVGRHAPERPDPNNHGVRIEQLLLPHNADPFEQCLAVVAVHTRRIGPDVPRRPEPASR